MKQQRPSSAILQREKATEELTTEGSCRKYVEALQRKLPVEPALRRAYMDVCALPEKRGVGVSVALVVKENKLLFLLFLLSLGYTLLRMAGICGLESKILPKC